MNSEPDLLVLGAGPAGVGAALAAASCGLRTVVVDSAPTSGGQVHRAMPASFQPLSTTGAQNPDQLIGEQQRLALQASNTETAFGRQVWSVGRDFRVDALGPNGLQYWYPQALVVATGAQERVTPFPGWTLPGVIGLAAATILLKSQLILPGRRTVVAGCGPLLALVAYTILRYGGQVVAVIDLASRRDWLHTAPSLLTRAAELRRGLSWRWRIQAAKVPWLYRNSIQAAQTHNGALHIKAGPVHADSALVGTTTHEFTADCLTVGHGLTPSTDIIRLLQAGHEYRRELGGWVPILDQDQRTTRPKLYAAGDGCGIRGAAVAYESGCIAGYTAAFDLGRISQAEYHRLSAQHRQQQQRLSHFSKAMAGLMAQRRGQVNSIAAETIICRCEDISRSEIEQALDQGITNVNQLKSSTRCGMGPCQGRVCGDTVAELVAARCHNNNREQAGIWTARVPLRPLTMEDFTGTFDYADIPIPQAAPL